MIQYIEYGIGWFALFCACIFFISGIMSAAHEHVEMMIINQCWCIGYLIVVAICFHS